MDQLDEICEESSFKESTPKLGFFFFKWFSHVSSNVTDLLGDLKDIDLGQMRYLWNACYTIFLAFGFISGEKVVSNSFFTQNPTLVFFYFFYFHCSCVIYVIPIKLKLVLNLSNDISFVSIRHRLIMIWLGLNYDKS